MIDFSFHLSLFIYLFSFVSFHSQAKRKRSPRRKRNLRTKNHRKRKKRRKSQREHKELQAMYLLSLTSHRSRSSKRWLSCGHVVYHSMLYFLIINSSYCNKRLFTEWEDAYCYRKNVSVSPEGLSQLCGFNSLLR